MNNKVEVEISPWSVVKIVLVLFLMYLVYLIKDILALLFIVIILSVSFRPTINKWEKKVGRVISVLALLLIILIAVSFISYIVFPPLIKQVEQLIQALPGIISRFNFMESYKSVIESGFKSLTNDIGKLTGSFINVTASVFGGIFAFITTVVLTIYLLLDRDGFSKFVNSVIPSDSREAVTNLARKMAAKVGDWLRGQMILSLCISVTYFIGLTAIGMGQYALTLAIISGIFDIIPVIGPLTAGAIAALVAFSYSPWHAAVAVILYVIIQQLENSILVPKIMQKAVGLSPIVIILAVMIGAKIFGLMGALLAVPLSASISVIIREWPGIKATMKND